MKDQKLQLYGVGFNVRPKPLHPMYWEVQSGSLWVFLLSDPGLTGDADSIRRLAAQAAPAIPAHIYEIVDDVVAFNTFKEGDILGHPAADHAVNTARNVGLSLLLNFDKTGEDEHFFRPAGE